MFTNSTKAKLISALLTVAIVGSWPTRAAAWGEEGHRIVAGIAERYLATHSPQALARAKQLLGGKDLMDVAVFADDVRDARPYTKNWHFVDIPVDEENYVATRDCKQTAKGDCAVNALFRFNAILADKSEDSCVRAEALKFVIHIVGDIHQPLHNINDDDFGGNGKIVSFYGFKGYGDSPPNLHQVWDSLILVRSKQTVPQLITELGGKDDPDISLSPYIWVTESHKLAQDAYERLPKPDTQHIYVLDSNDAYYEAALPNVKDQLAKGGLRLGKLLERALK